jgi:hypothetical protein
MTGIMTREVVPGRRGQTLWNPGLAAGLNMHAAAFT